MVMDKLDGAPLAGSIVRPSACRCETRPVTEIDTQIDERVRRDAAGVPEFAAFPTIDDLLTRFARLAEQYPRTARHQRVGTSRLGEPITCLTVGEGARQAVVFAFPHPNEPIGGLTALHLAEQLCADDDLRRELDLTWHVVGCIDPDGARLNEGWFAGPYTRTHYARHFYRPAGDEQVEWTFPFRYKRAYFDRILPETLALMRLIDDTKPALMCSLHNSELGGVYYYLSKELTNLYPVLQRIPGVLGLELHRGEPESPSIRQLADGIYAEMRSDNAYDYRESRGMDPVEFVSGASSSEYASRHGTTTLICELPYWMDPNASDSTPTTVTYAEVLGRQAEGLRDFVDTAGSVLADIDGQPLSDSPFLRASRYFIRALRRMPADNERRAAEASSRRPATVAERASCADLVHSFRLRYGGMLLRALDGELAIGNGTPVIRLERQRLAETYARWCVAAEEATPAQALPIRTLVATQYAAILATARAEGSA